MRILTRQESKKLDEWTSSRLNMSEELLMENVASQCALSLSQLARKKGVSKFFIVCGPGNNGGDGLVIARLLTLMGYECRIFAPQDTSSSLLESQRARLKVLGLELESFAEFLKTKKPEKKMILVDALFGIGLDRPLEEQYVSVIEKINSTALFTVSVDTPSGLDVDRGVEWGAAVRADVTLAVGALKPGFFTANGPLCVGKVKLIWGSFGEALFPETEEPYRLASANEILKWIPKRSKRSHKGSVGKCHIIAGSRRYLGAGRLCALGALSSGATFIHLYGSQDLRGVLQDLPEVVLHEEIADLFQTLKPMDSIVIGPGLEGGPGHKEVLEKLIEINHTKVLLDAGIFETLASLSKPVPVEWVCVPHPGELGLLLNKSVKEIEEDRFYFVKAAQEKYGCQFLLKGFQPILRTKEREWWCLPYGDSRLGKAGSGDVLAGLAGGLIAQMEESSKALSLAVYLEAQAAHLVTKGRNRHSLLVSELPSAIGKLLL